MTHAPGRGPRLRDSIREATEVIFGRWPAWPWSVLGLIVACGVAAAAAAPALRAAEVANPAALGTAACAGYGIVAAALASLLPRAWRLLSLRRDVVRRPNDVDATWWPLELLAVALRSKPELQRTQEHFPAAVGAAVDQMRTILADRLWPAWVTAFVAPVLGLMTAWHNGAQVQSRLQDGDAPAAVFPAFVAQVSPPMVSTIAAALALIVAVVAIDQWTKGLLLRWGGIVEAADVDHPAVRQQLSGEPIGEPHQPATERTMEERRHVDPDELERRWRASAARGE